MDASKEVGLLQNFIWSLTNDGTLEYERSDDGSSEVRTIRKNLISPLVLSCDDSGAITGGFVEEPKDWFFTFGTNHGETKYGLNRGRTYVKIHGTFREARDAMFSVYYNKWAFQYSSAEEAGVERFNLYEITLGE